MIPALCCVCGTTQILDVTAKPLSYRAHDRTCRRKCATCGHVTRHALVAEAVPRQTPASRLSEADARELIGRLAAEGIGFSWSAGPLPVPALVDPQHRFAILDPYMPPDVVDVLAEWIVNTAGRAEGER